MEIKTICGGCIFKGELGGCDFGKDTYLGVNHQQYVKGMCGHRRSKEWYNKLLQNDPDFSIDKSESYVVGEHVTLSIIVLSLNAEMDKITDTLDSIPNEAEVARQIIVVVQNASNSEERAILSRLYKKNCCVWTLDNIKRDDEISSLSAINYASRLVKNLWFLSMNAGDILGLEPILDFYKDITYEKNNYIGFYFDENDPIHVISHTGAFEIMEGHTEQPWLEKVKTFENWRDVCKKIS